MLYSITKEKCQENINKLGKVVCSGCGGKIVPLETIDNLHNPTFWNGCEKCMVFDNGVKLIVFEVALKMVKERNFRPYNTEEPDQKNSEYYDYWLSSQIRGASRIVNDILVFADVI